MLPQQQNMPVPLRYTQRRSFETRILVRSAHGRPASRAPRRTTEFVVQVSHMTMAASTMHPRDGDAAK